MVDLRPETAGERLEIRGNPLERNLMKLTNAVKTKSPINCQMLDVKVSSRAEETHRTHNLLKNCPQCTTNDNQLHSDAAQLIKLARQLCV